MAVRNGHFALAGVDGHRPVPYFVHGPLPPLPFLLLIESVRPVPARPVSCPRRNLPCPPSFPHVAYRSTRANRRGNKQETPSRTPALSPAQRARIRLHLSYTPSSLHPLSTHLRDQLLRLELSETARNNNVA